MQLLCHIGNDIGLADRLPAFDGQRMILIGLLAERSGDEFFAGHTLYGRKHPLVANALLTQAHDQFDLLVLDFVHDGDVVHEVPCRPLPRVLRGLVNVPSASPSAFEVRE